MKRILMAIMAVSVAVTFSAPAFAGDKEEKEKKDKKDSKVLVYADDKKDEKKKDDKDKDKPK
jgi:Ni/Co efflux regulator RcnB